MTQVPQHGRTLYDLVVDYTSNLDVARRRRLAEFLDVQDQTVNAWRRGKSVPTGARALRMHYLLAGMGSFSSDWKVEDESVVTVGKLVAFKVVSLVDIISTFSDKAVDEQNTVRMLCGHKHIKPEYLTVFQQIAADNESKLSSAAGVWSDLMVRNPREQLISELSNRLIAVLPMCEQMMTDDWTAEERHELRRRCGNDTVFKLYNALGALCGEKARQHTLRSAAASLVVNR